MQILKSNSSKHGNPDMQMSHVIVGRSLHPGKTINPHECLLRPAAMFIMSALPEELCRPDLGRSLSMSSLRFPAHDVESEAYGILSTKADTLAKDGNESFRLHGSHCFRGAQARLVHQTSPVPLHVGNLCQAHNLWLDTIRDPTLHMTRWVAIDFCTCRLQCKQ